MVKKKTSMWLSAEAFIILDVLSKQMGIPKTAIMELALREVYDSQGGHITYPTYEERKIQEIVDKRIKELTAT